MKKVTLFKPESATSIIIIALVVCAIGYIIVQNKVRPGADANSIQLLPGISKDIQLTTPTNTAFSGELLLTGVARAVYFEASFPARLQNSSNQIIWQGPATAQGDWMTADYVPFNLVIPTTTIPNGTYTLVLTQDDPSGEVPVNELYSVSHQITIQN